jgi:hypothetical protein
MIALFFILLIFALSWLVSEPLSRWIEQLFDSRLFTRIKSEDDVLDLALFREGLRESKLPSRPRRGRCN